MSALWTRDDAAAATRGASPVNWQVTGVSIDTRSLQPGDLFVALSAERDGHDFVAQAFEKGAAAALVSHKPEDVAPDAPLLVVPDVLDGLWDMARFARARFSGRLVAVTGSVGKTGSKDMLAVALGAQGRVHAAEKSHNNQWGVPLTLARMAADADFAVIEIGMNAPGEIGPLARLARPDVALITTVAPVHLAAFDNIRGIAREKAAIFAGMAPGGTAVLNRDIDTYPILLPAARKAGAVLVRFGATGRPEFRLTGVQATPGGISVSARARGVPLTFKLAAPGRHLAMNALGVLASVEALGGDIARAALALGQWTSPEGRGARLNIALGPGGLDGEIALIDESYNASPAAMAAAFDVLAGEKPQTGTGRRIAFLADMLELGPQERALHAGLAQIPALRAITIVHCAGKRMRALYDVLPISQRGMWFETSSDMAACAGRLIDPGDIVMIKGSLGSKAGLVVGAIKKLGEARMPENLEA